MLPDCGCVRRILLGRHHWYSRIEEPTFDPIEIRENTFAVAYWNRHQFEIPDVIGFADYATSSKAVADNLQAYEGAVEELTPLLPFPYPKPNNSLRWLHVAGPEELIVLRTAAGYVGQSTDQLLSSRVYSHRLDRSSRCWKFQKKAWAMYRTDIASYYPTVEIERLRSVLQDFGCLGRAALLILKMFRQWQLRDGLHGIPIGPQVSAIIGNFFLHPVDRLLEAKGYEHLRWCDDILTFGSTVASCQGSLAVLDEALSDLRLTRSAQKTRDFDNVYDARANLEDHLRTSLTDHCDLDADAGVEAVRSAFDSQLVGNPQVEQKRFRWIVKTLLHKHDSYGCLPLALDPSLMNVDPKLSGEYLREVALKGKRLKDKRVVDAILDRLSNKAEDRFDALDLHLLGAVRLRSFGSAEAEEFRTIATDSSRRWPVRVFGWAAYVKTTKNYSELEEAARAEANPQLRRGMIAKLRGHATRPFLAHARMNFPESRYTVQWLQAA
jgi:hypothetical protein